LLSRSLERGLFCTEYTEAAAQSSSFDAILVRPPKLADTGGRSVY
jgi:hypothetical protein